MRGDGRASDKKSTVLYDVMWLDGCPRKSRATAINATLLIVVCTILTEFAKIAAKSSCDLRCGSFMAIFNAPTRKVCQALDASPSMESDATEAGFPKWPNPFGHLPSHAIFTALLAALQVALSNTWTKSFSASSCVLRANSTLFRARRGQDHGDVSGQGVWILLFKFAINNEEAHDAFLLCKEVVRDGDNYRKAEASIGASTFASVVKEIYTLLP